MNPSSVQPTAPDAKLADGKCRTCGVELPATVRMTQCERCTTSGELLLSHFSTVAPAPENVAAPLREDGIDLGDYVLLNEIARGGMGSVYRARQKSLNRIVAVKRPLPGISADPERVRRFRTEAESVAALSHPNIIPVFESGEWNGEQFFSMAYVEGQSLGEILRKRTVTPMEAARYVKKIADAIHHAHQRGVLHRDLKPANIIVDRQDEPRVADFGIACLLRGNEENDSAKVVGTANYMAPEQIQPGSKPLSVATDVYALGGILYHLLTGRPPFDGENREEIFWSAYYEEPVPPTQLNPKIPRDLEAICLKALEKRPEQRYASAQSMADDLVRFEHRRPVVARPVSAPVRLWMWTRRNPFTALLLASLAAALVVGIGAQMLAIERIRSARAASEGFIGFMNQDLADNLRQVGRLDLMEKINARAEDYYTNYAALGDSGYLERKARFFENSAATEEELGHLGRADAYAAEAERIYQEQSQFLPTEARWKRLLSRVRVLRLNIAKDGGLRSEANAHGEVASLAANEALALNPTDRTNRANVAQVLLAKVDIWVLQNRAEISATNVTQAEKLLREATGSGASDPDWELSLANCAYYRARISQLRGAYDSALSRFTEYLSGMQELAARYPRNNRWQYELAVANAQVAAALTQLKQTAAAQPYVETFERLAHNLSSLDPRNATWLSLYGKSLAWRGVAENTLNSKGSSGLNYLNLALTIQSNLVQQNPDWEQWAENAAETTRALISLHVREGRLREAIELSGDWLRQCEARALNAPDHAGHQLRWGAAIVGDIRLNRRQDGTAGQIERFRSALKRFEGTRPNSPVVLAQSRVLAGLAEAYENDPAKAAAELRRALDLRLELFASSPNIARIRDLIPNNYLWVAAYQIRSGHIDSALAVAEEGLNWAARHLSPEEGRRDFSQLCLNLAQGAPASGAVPARVRQIIERCIVEQFHEPPALSKDEESWLRRLQEWMDQHP